MKLTRRPVRALALVLLVVVVLSAAVAPLGLWLYRPPVLPQGARAIVVLSSGFNHGYMGPRTIRRTDRGIALWKTHAAPLVVFSGGIRWQPPGAAPVTVAERMAERARAAGVPSDAIRIEGRSHSTLENALFTARLLGPDLSAPIILVTSRFHLPRAWASFRWAGFTNITGVASDPHGPDSLDIGVMWRETLKAPGNALRAGFVTGLEALGVPPRTLQPLLQ